MQDIIMNRKRYLRKFEHKQMKLPLWPELSIARIWPEAHKLPRMTEYLPSEWGLANPKKIERNWFFGIVTSLAPEYIEMVVLDIRSLRINQKAGRAVQPTTISVSTEWVD